MYVLDDIAIDGNTLLNVKSALLDLGFKHVRTAAVFSPAMPVQKSHVYSLDFTGLPLWSPRINAFTHKLWGARRSTLMDEEKIYLRTDSFYSIFTRKRKGQVDLTKLRRIREAFRRIKIH